MLQNKNKYEYGIVATSYTLMLDYDTYKNRSGQRIEVKVHKTAELDFDPKYDGNSDDRMGIFQKIVDFQKSGNALLREAKRLLEAGQYIRVSILTGTREHVEEYMDYAVPGHPMRSTLRFLSSNCWEYAGSGTDGELDAEEGGLYFRPDTRYTDERHDMFLPWGKDILKLLAEVGI